MLHVDWTDGISARPPVKVDVWQEGAGAVYSTTQRPLASLQYDETL